MVRPTTDLAARYCDDADRIQSEEPTPLLCGIREALAPSALFDMDQSVRSEGHCNISILVRTNG